MTNTFVVCVYAFKGGETRSIRSVAYTGPGSMARAHVRARTWKARRIADRVAIQQSIVRGDGAGASIRGLLVEV